MNYEFFEVANKELRIQHTIHNYNTLVLI